MSTTTKPTVTLTEVTEPEERRTLTLPSIISEVKYAHRGFRVRGESGQWKYYATVNLSPEQVGELEDWLEELRPRKRAA